MYLVCQLSPQRYKQTSDAARFSALKRKQTSMDQIIEWMDEVTLFGAAGPLRPLKVSSSIPAARPAHMYGATNEGRAQTTAITSLSQHQSSLFLFLYIPRHLDNPTILEASTPFYQPLTTHLNCLCYKLP
ncbi:hypothetical protein H0G86_003970 [Trichoderma simmonsii]|uniref:Uncharacterized protein n=1 Tax=Trichoderma simmonsii TaxID=1491479 RepID=A0A8G0L6W1_9HYPO|nr:hypothetical protein H0G86_003970 [Trichoderma simmonsii]